MQNERFMELIKTITNLDMDEPSDWDVILPPETYDSYKRALLEFRIRFRRDFPEWHVANGKFIGDKAVFDWGLGDARSIRDGVHSVLRDAWQFASTGEVKAAANRIEKLSSHFHRKLKNAKEKRKEALILIIETFKWLEGRAGSLKVCQNAKCSTGNKYFFKIYNNDKYCSSSCGTEAKALRQVQRDAESAKPVKIYKVPEQQRENMAIAAEARWAKARAHKGKKKGE